MEFAVAMMLILLGAINLAGRGSGAASARSTARPLLVGFVHGLAGSAFIALLVVAAVPGLLRGLLYLAVFGLGTVAGMAVITAVIAIPSALTARQFGHLQRYLRVASGLASVAFGVLLVANGIADGLFSSAPQWTPR
jgi:high-affinity nickel-transport protein